MDVKKFLSKHGGAVTIVGGVVVFVTFVVHEGLREQQKKLVDAVDSAQNNFLLRDEIADFGRRGGSGLFEKQQRLQSAQLYFELANGDISFARFSLGSIRRLEKEIPASSSDQKETDLLVNNLARISESEHSEVEKYFDGKPLNEANNFRAMQDAAELRRSCETLTDKLLRAAEEKRAAAAYRYSAATWASYVLYTLGWGLSLISKLYGAKETLAAE